MTHVAQEWAQTHGGERGFTMGTFDPAYLQTQRCFLAYQNNSLVGFISLATVAREWTLDLMRHSDDIPDGTMHALVTAAITAAQTEGVARLSLAAVPYRPGQSAPRLSHAFWARLGTACGGGGLSQFKASFAPHWEVLYMAAPSRFAIALGALDVTRAVISQPAGDFTPFSRAVPPLDLNAPHLAT